MRSLIEQDIASNPDDVDQKDIPLLHFIYLLNNPDRLIKFFDNFYSRRWIVYKNVTSVPFWTSDNPVVFTGNKNELACPLSSDYLIAITPDPIFILDANGEEQLLRGDLHVVEMNAKDDVKRYNQFQLDQCYSQAMWKGSPNDIDKFNL